MWCHTLQTENPSAQTLHFDELEHAQRHAESSPKQNKFLTSPLLGETWSLDISLWPIAESYILPHQSTTTLLGVSEKKNQRIGDSNSGTLKWMLWKAPPGLASSSGHMKISPAAQCLRQGVEQLGIRRDDSFPKEVTGTVRLEFCRVGSLGILMLLCAVKARQIRSCLNEALIALHSNVTNNPECGTLSLFCSSSFIWRLREFETIHYSWSWLLFFATKSFCFTVIGPCL